MEEYKIRTTKEFSEQYELQTEIEWPEFMMHDPISNHYWKGLFEVFPEYQFSLFEGEDVLGYGNSIPLNIDLGTIRNLDDRGWDWALEKGFNDRAGDRTATVLCGLQIGLNKRSKGKGVSCHLIDGMREIARKNDLKAVILPIRPTMKCKYPLIKTEDYIKWKNEDGLPFDPWIRVHTRLGGEIIRVCNQAMYIPGTIDQWEEWTGLKMKTSGDYIIEGALVPVRASIENNIAEYTEPNVWMIHHL